MSKKFWKDKIALYNVILFVFVYANMYVEGGFFDIIPKGVLFGIVISLVLNHLICALCYMPDINEPHGGVIVLSNGVWFFLFAFAAYTMAAGKYELYEIEAVQIAIKEPSMSVMVLFMSTIGVNVVSLIHEVKNEVVKEVKTKVAKVVAKEIPATPTEITSETVEEGVTT